MLSFSKSTLVPFCCFSVTSVALYLYDKYFVTNVEDESDAILRAKLGLDVLGINKSLALGIQRNRCDIHVSGIVKCEDLECSYGPLSYMLNMIGRAQKSVDVCIYVITAQVFADAIIEAHKRGLRVRIIADSDLSFSELSSVNQFRKLELPVRQRMSPFIMHHKFILVDDCLLMSGSINLTMTAVLGNWENVIVSSHPGLVEPYVKEFQTLWDDFDPIDRI